MHTEASEIWPIILKFCTNLPIMFFFFYVSVFVRFVFPRDFCILVVVSVFYRVFSLSALSGFVTAELHPYHLVPMSLSQCYVLLSWLSVWSEVKMICIWSS